MIFFELSCPWLGQSLILRDWPNIWMHLIYMIYTCSIMFMQIYNIVYNIIYNIISNYIYVYIWEFIAQSPRHRDCRLEEKKCIYICMYICVHMMYMYRVTCDLWHLWHYGLSALSRVFFPQLGQDSTAKCWDISWRKLLEDLPGHADEVPRAMSYTLQ